MTVTEKSAFLRGLVSGLDLEENAKETKIIKAMMDVIDDLALSVSDLEDELALVTEQLDAVDEDLDSLEEYVYDDCDDDCCCDDYDDEMYEVECPACGEVVEFDEDSILDGSAECPNCGEKLEFDLSGCDCGCEDCSDCNGED